jgi:L-seryl-tRNA(Ser) seleniumtransferase
MRTSNRASAVGTVPARYAVDPYGALGLRKFINATCHWTRLGGTLMPEPVLDAMRAAAHSYVDMAELQKAAGRVIAKHTHAEDGYVVSGCAAALLVGAAAMLTGKDPARMMQLPDLTGMKSEAIAKRFDRRRAATGTEYIHYGYAHAVKTTGVRFVEVGDGRSMSEADLRAAFTDRTALLYRGIEEVSGDLPLPRVIEIAHEHDVPVLVDSSNALPPRENLWRFIDWGADLVAFSGGKGLRGPQGSGILAGRRELIEAAAMQAAPTQGIGRVAKVSKEEVVGLVAALEWWAAQDDEARLTEERRKAQLLADRIGRLRNGRVELLYPDHLGRLFATVWVRVDRGSKMTAADLLKQLYDGDPPIAAMGHSDPRVARFDVRLCEDSEIEAIAARVREALG